MASRQFGLVNCLEAMNVTGAGCVLNGRCVGSGNTTSAMHMLSTLAKYYVTVDQLPADI